MLIAGGIGVTAIRALLEDLPSSTEPVVLLRASTDNDLVLSAEVAELAQRRKGCTYRFVGPRSSVKLERMVDLVPDLKTRDVYVAGPEEFVAHMVSAIARLGVPRDAIHFDEYALG